MRIGAYGEVMLRLTPPEYRTLEQTHSLPDGFSRNGRKYFRNPARINLSASLLTSTKKPFAGDAGQSEFANLWYQHRIYWSVHKSYRRLFLLKLVLAFAPPM